ncbi:MAG: hypothetical protein H0T53_01750 [Herpetosiphonaceae bacterium]|nr:hypothetical protein [Herpetosiphonaceae bacterium]
MVAGVSAQQTTQRRVIATMAAGLSWKDACQQADAAISRSTAFRWHARARATGATVVPDQRHGHVWLVDQAVQDWMVTYCQAHPHTPSHLLKTLVETALQRTISVSHLNVVRARLGITYQRPRHEKKDPASPQP